MAFRSKETIGSLILNILFAAVAVAQPASSLEARHDHWRGSCAGVLTVTADNISYSETAAKKKTNDLHAWTWKDIDVQEFRIESGKVTLLTYNDRGLALLGADRTFEFFVDSDKIRPLSQELSARLGSRLVVAFANPPVQPLWELPVKRIGMINGSHGRLIVGTDVITFDGDGKGNSRTWTLDDVVNVSMSGPFQLTITTYERDKRQYGSVKSFVFQLKLPLDERKYDDLWLAVNQRKGLRMLP